MSPVFFINQDTMSQLSTQAANAPRQRLNQNFHQHSDDACHRLMIAIEPGSYIPPHCHQSPNKEESIIILRGRVGVLIFDTAGQVTQHVVLQAGGDTVAVNLPPGTFHSLVSLEAGSLFFEAKGGPYTPPAEAERASWAPLENTPEAPAYLAYMRSFFS
ncbi:cupin fold WbuC family metalloprotein [Chitinivorax tropicus]|uniref:Cupin fold WbuC family metalloprotein n=1 Tax=Chitinivorax tropicus TaxID=714531 RepID=A0A840MTN9_9PROT|nr:WbuC family cupin fold metalloprotein [Chitinivorax tropicus]MBB5019736.1 cupin fold WbuC family metalloprotein [Chitinivorax tropicus]